jgi:hypothetical protein
MPEAPAPAPPSVTMATPEGELVAVPAAQARDLYLSGKLGFVEGQDVPIDVGGKTQFLPADQAGRALEGSYTASVKGTAQAQREQRLEELGGVGGTLAAAGIEAGNQLLLGAGKGIAADLVDPHLWPEAHARTKAYLRDVEEANPIASGIGGAAGLVLPLLASGGTAAGARGLARGAAAAEAANLARGGVAAVEGAEAVSAAARARGLFGATLDAATALPRGVGAVGELAGGLAERAAVAAGAKEGGAIASILRGSAQGAAEMPFYSLGDAVSRATLHDEELTAEKLAAAAGHGFLWGGAFGGGLSAAGQLLAGTGRAAKAGAAKASELAEKIGADVPKTLEGFAERKAIQATGATKEQAAKLSGMGPEVESRVARQMTEDVPRLTGKADLATVSRAELTEAAPLLRKEKGEAVGKLVADLDKIEGVAAPSAERIAARIEKEVESPLRKSPLTEDVADAVASMRERVGQADGFGALWGERFAGKADAPTEAARAKVRDIVESEVERAAAQAGEKAGAEWSARFAQAKSEHQAARWLEEAATKGEARPLVGPTEGLAALHGLAIGGPAGAAVGLAGAVGRSLVQQYGAQVAAAIATRAVKSDLIRAASEAVTARIGGSVDRFLAGKVSRAGAGAQLDADVSRSRKAADAAFARERAELSGFLAAPDARLARSTAGLDAGTAAAVRSTATRSAAYLQSKAPPELAPNPLTPGMSKPQVSPAMRDDFLAAARAVKDPMSVIDDFEHGRLTRAGVEALKATSPRLLGELQAAVLAKVAEKGAPESYAKSLQLGILLGIPTDATLDPAFIGKVQATYAPETASGGTPAGPAPPVRRIGPINVAAGSMTRTEQLLGGK